MRFINWFGCETCHKHTIKRIISDELVKDGGLCEICGNPLTHERSFEKNDRDETIREYIGDQVHDCHNLFKELNSTQSKPIITCPYCQSTNCKKLSVVSRGVSFGLFGFGSGKLGKQYHCSNCNSDF